MKRFRSVPGRFGRFALLPLLALAGAARSQEPLSLPKAIEIAQRQNPRLVAARSEVAAARAGTRMARARRGPMLSANGFATAGNNPSILSGPPNSEPLALMRMGPDPMAVANLMLMLPVTTGGVLEGAVAAARALEAAADGEQLEMSADVTLMVTESYVMFLFSRSMIAAEEARVRASEEMVRNTEAQVAAGTGIQASVLRAQAEAAMARRELIAAKNEQAKLLLDLKAAMGVEPEDPLKPEVALARPQPIPLEDALAQALSRRGRVLQARARLQEAEAQVRGAEGALRPKVYGAAMADASSDPMMRGGLTFGIVASLPVFDGGMRRAEVSRMRSMRDRAKALVKEAELAVATEVRKAWLDITAAREQFETANAAVQAAEASYHVVDVRVTAGKGILVEQLDALQALTRARSELAQAEANLYLTHARLVRAIGVNP